MWAFLLSQQAESTLSWWCVRFSLQWLLLMQSSGSRVLRLQQLQILGSRAQAQIVVAHGLSCPTACGILADEGSNPCRPHWQADSLLLKLSHSVASDFLRPHGLQHARLPCPSPIPRACSNSCPSSH